MKSEHLKEYQKEWMRAFRAAHNLKNGYRDKGWKRKAEIRLKKSVNKLNSIAYEYHLPMRKHDWWKLGEPSYPQARGKTVNKSRGIFFKIFTRFFSG